MKRLVMYLLAGVMLVAGLNYTACGQKNVDDKGQQITPAPEDEKNGATNTPIPADSTSTTKPTENTTTPVPSGENNTTTGGEDKGTFSGEIKVDGTVTILDVKSKCIRSHCFNPEANKNGTYVISSAEELANYIAAYKTTWSFDDKYDEESLTEAFSAYDAEFFKNNDLVIVRRTATSGSIKYNVVGLDLVPATETGAKKLEAVIKANQPGDMGTCDMAYWHILIEVSKEYKVSEYEHDEVKEITTR